MCELIIDVLAAHDLYGPNGLCCVSACVCVVGLITIVVPGRDMHDPDLSNHPCGVVQPPTRHSAGTHTGLQGFLRPLGDVVW